MASVRWRGICLRGCGEIADVRSRIGEQYAEWSGRLSMFFLDKELSGYRKSVENCNYFPVVGLIILGLFKLGLAVCSDALASHAADNSSRTFPFQWLKQLAK